MTPPITEPTGPINVVALVKGEERYILLFDDQHATEALRTLGRWAINPDLSLSWFDAAVMSQRVREQMENAKCEGKGAVQL